MNKAIQRNHEAIRAKALEVAISDQKVVHRLTKFSASFQPETMPKLLDFVNDAFIMELLPNLTKYMFFAEKKELYHKHALQKANEIVSLLRQYHADARKSIKTS